MLMNSFLNHTDTKFPFFNLYTVPEVNTSVIEIAVAGYDKSELEIQNIGEYISVKGSKEANDVEKCFLVRGISSKNFVKKFYIGSRKVKAVKLANGILSISLEEVLTTKDTFIKIED